MGYPESGLAEHATKLLEIDQLIVEDAVRAAVAEKTVVRENVEGDPWLYLVGLCIGPKSVWPSPFIGSPPPAVARVGA